MRAGQFFAIYFDIVYVYTLRYGQKIGHIKPQMTTTHTEKSNAQPTCQ